MSAVSYPLGTPRSAANRGGDCRARDLTQARNVHGHHRFAATTDCRINNGLIRLTVGAAGAAPSLTIQAWRRVIEGDALSDILSDTLPGALSTGAWVAMGTLTIDSPAVSALLTGVRIVRVNAEVITIRLIAPLMADAYVTLRRFYRSVLIQHGATRGTLVDITRRVRLAGPPTLTGAAGAGRVTEDEAATVEGLPRFVAALDADATANAGAFSMTSLSSVSARFGAGVATLRARDLPYDQQRQLSSDVRSMIVMETA